MGWPYHFDGPSGDGLQDRRHMIDKYGLIAQVSAIAVLLLVGAYQWVFNRRQPTNGAAYAPIPTDTAEPADGGNDGVEMQPPSHFDAALDEDEADETTGEPVAAPAAATASAPAEKPDVRRSRLGAWLDTPLRDGWKETRRQAISVGLWACWVGSLAVRETGQDYLHLTKRFAHIAAALLPFHYLLGTPSPLSPLPRLFRVTTSSIYNPYHRLHAVLMLGLLACHAGFYLNFYFWVGKLPGRLFDIEVLLGLTMAASLLVLTVLARQTIRYDPKRRSWFVGSHLIVAGGVPVLLFFHASPARWYAIEAAVVFGIVLVGRAMRGQR